VRRVRRGAPARGLRHAPLHRRCRTFRPLLELAILQVQSFRGGINPMRAGQFSRRRPQRIRNRHARRVRTPPPLETQVDLPHVWGNNRNLGWPSSVLLAPWGNGQTLATSVSSSHAPLPKGHNASSMTSLRARTVRQSAAVTQSWSCRVITGPGLGTDQFVDG